MVRSIEVDPDEDESKCGHCGYKFEDLEDALRHFNEECNPTEDGIKHHDFKAEIKIIAPSLNRDKARQLIKDWEENVQNAIGGLTFQIKELEGVK